MSIKKIILPVCSLVFTACAVAQVKNSKLPPVSQEKTTTYFFKLPEDSGPVKEVTILITESKELVLGEVRAKLNAGGKLEAQARCYIILKNNLVNCTRDDGGGHFDILFPDSQGKEGPKLRLRYFDLAPEQEESVAIESPQKGKDLIVTGQIVPTSGK